MAGGVSWGLSDSRLGELGVWSRVGRSAASLEVAFAAPVPAASLMASSMVPPVPVRPGARCENPSAVGGFHVLKIAT